MAVTVKAIGNGGTGLTDLSQIGLNNLSGSGNIWKTVTYSFTASSASTELEFLGQQGADYIGLDNASLTANSVPDGGLTIAMLGMGISGLAFIRRKL